MENNYPEWLNFMGKKKEEDPFGMGGYPS